MSNLKVIELDGVFVVDSRLIAERLDIDHKSFIKTVRKYQTKVEQRFGHIRFQVETVTNSVKAVNEIKFAYLTEDQATAIMTFSKNTETVIDCKLELVESFSKAKEVIKQFAIPQTRAEALRLAADLEEKLAEKEKENQFLLGANQVLQIEVETLEPKAERYDLVMDSEGWLTGEQIVKQLAIPKFSVRKLYDILRKEKVLFKRPDGTNCPYALWVNHGFAKLRDGQCFDGRMRFSPAFSWKGLDRILDILRLYQVIPKDKQYRFNFDSNKIVPMKKA